MLTAAPVNPPVSQAEVDAFVEELLRADVGPIATAGLQQRATVNLPSTAAAVCCAASVSARLTADVDAVGAAAAAAEGTSAPPTLVVAALRAENALLRAAVERLRRMVAPPQTAPASAEVVARLVNELAQCRAVMAEQAAELRAVRAADARVVGMQGQIDELRGAVRELSVQASQSRAASFARDAADGAQSELLMLRRVICEQQQRIVALQEMQHRRPAGVYDSPGEDPTATAPASADGLVWEDPEPSLPARGTNLHSPSRASGRVCYADAEREESPHPLRASLSTDGVHCCDSAEPEPVPRGRGCAAAWETEAQACAAAGVFAGSTLGGPAPRRVRVSHCVVEEVASHLPLRHSLGSEVLPGVDSSGTATPPPRATIVLNGLHTYTSSLDEGDGTGRSTGSHTTDASHAVQAKRAGVDAAGEVLGEGESRDSALSVASSDVSYVGRKPRGAISLSRARPSFVRDSPRKEGEADTCSVGGMDS